MGWLFIDYEDTLENTARLIEGVKASIADGYQSIPGEPALSNGDSRTVTCMVNTDEPKLDLDAKRRAQQAVQQPGGYEWAMGDDGKVRFYDAHTGKPIGTTQRYRDSQPLHPIWGTA